MSSFTICIYKHFVPQLLTSSIIHFSARVASLQQKAQAKHDFINKICNSEKSFLFPLSSDHKEDEVIVK